MKTDQKNIFSVKGIAVFVGAFALTIVALAATQWSSRKKEVPAAAPASGPPPGMRWIPAGEFAMGTDDPDSQPNERPAHRAKVAGFWIDIHDVTNAQFREFVQATGYLTTAERPVDWEELKKQVPPGTPKPPDEMLQPGALVFTPTDHEVPFDDVRVWWRWVSGASWRHPQGPQSTIVGKDDYPVVQVSWDDAVAYAKWAGKRLPIEAEWEYAARGGLGGKRFAWGDEFRPGGKFLANTYTGTFPVKDTAEDGYAGTSPWNAFPPNGYGLYDMAGNVWQWTADVYSDSSAQGTCPMCVSGNPQLSLDPALLGEVRRVIKGGSFLCSEQYCESYRPSARRGTPRDTGSEHVGFRCVMSGPR
jgi:formylglycine-generating enzyme required for sulfatase activity